MSSNKRISIVLKPLFLYVVLFVIVLLLKSNRLLNVKQYAVADSKLSKQYENLYAPSVVETIIKLYLNAYKITKK